MAKDIKFVRDLHDYDISNPTIDIRVFGTVWATVETLDDGGGVGVQHLSGYPQVNREYFEDMLGIAGGLFGLEPDEPIDEVRFESV